MQSFRNRDCLSEGHPRAKLREKALIGFLVLFLLSSAALPGCSFRVSLESSHRLRRGKDGSYQDQSCKPVFDGGGRGRVHCKDHESRPEPVGVVLQHFCSERQRGGGKRSLGTAVTIAATDHDSAAKPQPGVDEAVRLQRSDFSIPPTAAVTVVGLRVEKNATRNKAPITKVKTVSTCFMFCSYAFSSSRPEDALIDGVDCIFGASGFS